MVEKLYIFEYRFNDEELEQEFNNFFYRNNLIPLFTNEHRTSNIMVGYNDAKGVANATGSYAKDLKEFSDVLTWSSDNKSYEEALFKVIYGVKEFSHLMRRIRELVRFIQNEIDVGHLFNLWNIVWYNKDIL